MRPYVIIGLIVFLIVWRLFGKRIMAAFLLREAGRGALKAIGQKAILKQPDWVTLQRVASPTWTNAAAVRDLVSPLKMSGFTDVGSFSVDKMPGVMLEVLVNSDDHVAAHVYDHPKAGNWIELVTRYGDGSSTTVTTLPSTGLDLPPFVTTFREAKGTRVTELVQKLINHRRSGTMLDMTADNVVRQFEENYAKYTLWRKNTGVRPEELTKIVQDWAAKKDGQAAGR